MLTDRNNSGKARQLVYTWELFFYQIVWYALLAKLTVFYIFFRKISENNAMYFLISSI